MAGNVDDSEAQGATWARGAVGGSLANEGTFPPPPLSTEASSFL